MTVNPFGLGNERGAVGLSVSQPLLSGSGLFAPKYNQVMNAKSALTIQEKTATYSQQSTVFNVVSAYYQAVLARSQVGIQNSAVQAAEDSAKFLRRKVDAGFEAGIGLAQADVAVMQAKESLTSAQQNAQTALDSLMLTMGIGVGSSPELVDDVPDYDPPLPGLSEAIRTALTNRFEIVQYNEQVLEQRRALAMANDQLRSGLGVTASWTSTQANSGFVGNSLVDLASTFVGVKLTVPLDQRSLRESRDISARALDLVQKERGATDEQLADNVRLAFHSVEAARASVANLSENQKVVNLQVFQAQRRLEEGLGTTFDLVTAHNDQATFKVQLQTARVNLYLAHLQLNLAMGERVNAVGAK
jgi:outer membrane protein